MMDFFASATRQRQPVPASFAGLLAVCTLICAGTVFAQSGDSAVSTAQPPAPSTPLARAAKAERDPAKLGIGRTIPDLAFAPIVGERKTISRLLSPPAGGVGDAGAPADAAAAPKALVILMTSTGCPISRKYAPRAAILEREFKAKGVAFMFINAVEAETTTEMADHVREVGLAGPYVADRDLALARALGARTTSEVFVLDAQRRLVYRGAIDDQFAIGAAADEPTRPFLRETLAALVAGKEPALHATWAPGCLLDIEDEAPATPAPAPVTPNDPAPAAVAPSTPAPAATKPAAVPTFHGSIAQVLARNCLECHRTGGVAPFSLENPGLIQGRARMIEAVVRDGLMPPTHGSATGPSGAAAESFTVTREMPAADRAALLAWIAGGRPVGEPAPAPVLPPISPTWKIGAPEAILLTPGIDLPPDGPMQHQRVIMAVARPNDMWAAALEMRSQPPNLIHSAQVWLLPPGSTVPEPGQVPPAAEFLGAYSNTDNIVQFPPGVARHIPAGSLLLVDAYARPMGKRMFASLRVAIKDAAAATPDAPPTHAARSLVLSPKAFTIPSGQSGVRVTAELTLAAPAKVGAVTPLMRSRGSKLSLEATKPDGSRVTLLALPHFDWRWQIRFALKEPLELPAGTRIELTGTFDSSDANPLRIKPGEAAMGVSPTDELLMAAIEVIEPRGK